MADNLRSRLARNPSRFLQLTRRLFWMWRDDRRAKGTLFRKVPYWLRGFRMSSAEMYGFPRADERDYFDDYHATFRIREINASLAFYQHKLAQRALLLAAGFPQTPTVAVIWDGRVVLHPLSGREEPGTMDRLRAWLIEDGGRYVLKPEDGGRGSAIWLLESRAGALVCRRGTHEEPFPPAALADRLMLVERYMDQAEFWRTLFPGTLNTVRVLTLWPGAGHPFIARACQRIGAADTIPCDNASAGGISAEIDLAAGRMGPGRRRRRGGTQTLTHHPDSGAPIEGAVLPGWPAIAETALRAATSMPMNCYVGWDLFVGSTGQITIGEASGSTGVGIYQVHRGLLADPAVRRFFEDAGVL
jgi:hypothetical protein